MHYPIYSYLDQLRQIYYYPIAIIAVTTVCCSGFEAFIIISAKFLVIIMYIAIVGQFMELACFCTMGTLVEISVSYCFYLFNSRETRQC